MQEKPVGKVPSEENDTVCAIQGGKVPAPRWEWAAGQQEQYLTQTSSFILLLNMKAGVVAYAIMKRDTLGPLWFRVKIWETKTSSSPKTSSDWTRSRSGPRKIGSLRKIWWNLYMDRFFPNRNHVASCHSEINEKRENQCPGRNGLNYSQWPIEVHFCLKILHPGKNWKN